MSLFTDSVAFDNSTASNLYDEFTGSYGSRFVGWLWFDVDGSSLYQKNVDVVLDGSEWKLSYNGVDYYGTEPLRYSSLTYNSKTEPTQSVTVEYTTSKINRQENSLSIPNSTEVTSV